MGGFCVPRWRCRAVIVVGIAMLNTGCTLVSPGCRNRDIKATIEQEARASIELWLATSQQAELPTATPLQLVEPVEVSRKDLTRACSAKIAVGSGDKVVTVPIEYEVIGGDDGQALYRWNKEEFGKTFIAARLFSLLPQIARQPPTDDKNSNNEDENAPPGANTVAPQPDRAPEHRQQNRLSIEQWHDEVVFVINAQAINFRIEGSGSVTLGFLVSATGNLSNIRILQSSGNAGLDKTALQMAQRAANVRPPPGQRATEFSMKLAFL